MPPAPEHQGYAWLVRELLAAVDGGRLLSVHMHRTTDAVAEHVQRVVVVPSTVHGLADATALIGTWRPSLARPVLLVVRDAPLPVPPTVAERVRALKGRVEHTLELPYLHQLRMVHEPAQALTAKGRDVARMRRVLERVCRTLYASTFLAAGAPSAAEPVPTPELTPAHAVRAWAPPQ